MQRKNFNIEFGLWRISFLLCGLRDFCVKSIFGIPDAKHGVVDYIEFRWSLKLLDYHQHIKVD